MPKSVGRSNRASKMVVTSRRDAHQYLSQTVPADVAAEAVAGKACADVRDDCHGARPQNRNRGMPAATLCARDTRRVKDDAGSMR